MVHVPYPWTPLDAQAIAEIIPHSLWWLSGGVAIDRWLAEQTRSHADVDVSFLREDWRSIAESTSARFELYGAHDGVLEKLDENLPERIHNIWMLDPRRGSWVLQLNVESGDADEWRYRRLPSIRRPWSDAVSVIEGIRTIAPSVQLLWKSKEPQPKDEDDLAQVWPRLDLGERSWLRSAISTAHPDSRWVRVLGE